jgi:hypothetical protein
MRTFVLLAAVAALGACSQAAEEPDDTAAAEPAATPTATAAAADGKAGTYEFVLDGKKTTSVLMADGRYSDTQDGKVTETGLWAEHDGKTCFDPAGDDTPGTCFTTTEPDANGVFTATPDSGGEPLTITKVS